MCCLLSFAKCGWICAESTALYTSQFILLLTRAVTWSVNISSSGSYTCSWHNIFFFVCFLLFLSFLGKPDLILLFLECNQSSAFPFMKVSLDCRSWQWLAYLSVLDFARWCKIVFLNQQNSSATMNFALCDLSNISVLLSCPVYCFISMVLLFHSAWLIYMKHKIWVTDLKIYGFSGMFNNDLITERWCWMSKERKHEQCNHLQMQI